MTSCESKASPSLSAWTSFMALSWSLFLMFEKMDSFQVSSMSCSHRNEQKENKTINKKILKITQLYGEGGENKTESGRPHFADDAVLYVGLLVASLLAHQSDLQLAERFGQDVTLREELPPLHDVGLQQRCVVLVTQHTL